MDPLSSRRLRSLAWRAGRKLYQYARREGANDPARNGEYWLLDAIVRRADGSSLTLLDVGANVGMYSVFAGLRGVRVVAFEPESSNYALLNEGSARIAHLLKEKGLEKGDRVGIMLPNVPYFAIAYYSLTGGSRFAALGRGAAADPRQALREGLTNVKQVYGTVMAVMVIAIVLLALGAALSQDVPVVQAASRAAFQLTPKSWRLILVFALTPALVWP